MVQRSLFVVLLVCSAATVACSEDGSETAMVGGTKEAGDEGLRRPTAAEVPIPEDFAEQAAKEIDAESYREHLASLRDELRGESDER